MNFSWTKNASFMVMYTDDKVINFFTEDANRGVLPEEEAKADAKMGNKFLTPGEKKYYRLSYSAVLRSKIKEC